MHDSKPAFVEGGAARPAAGEAPFGRSPTGCPLSRQASDFDPFEDAYQADPAEVLRWSRDREPVFYSPKLGYWIVTRYEDVKAVFRDNVRFSPSIALEKITPAPPEAEQILKGYGYAMGRTMVNEDEPAHMDRRRLLLESFAPEAIARHAPMVRRLTRQFVDRLIDKGEADLVAEMFWEIPLTVALHFLGVREDDITRLRQFSLAHTINTWGRPTHDQQLHVADSVGRFWQAANQTLDAMMADPSGDGWMYFSIRQHLAHPDIVPLSYLRSMMMAILAAAHETTAKATANAFRLLLSDRQVWNDVCGNPALIPNVVEECLRRAGSIIAWRRLATVDARIGDVAIPKGAKLMIVMASANHDERHFENPDVLDPYRDNSAEHMSFGYGAHQCMGKNIARMEMRIFVEEFVTRLPHIELTPGQEFKYLPNISFRGPESLRVRWNPEQNPERQDRSILDRHQAVAVGAPERSDIMRRMRVAAVRREAEGVTGFALESSDGTSLPAWSPGAHIDLSVGGYDRKYSLCGPVEDATHFHIAVLKEEESRGCSRFIHENLKAGDVVSIRGPKNHFRLDEDAASYVLIAGGIGITPIIAMADRLKRLGKSYVIHYCGRVFSSMAFVDRLKGDHGGSLRLYSGAEGQHLDIPEVVGQVTASRQVYACGPNRLLANLEDLAKDWPQNVLHLEYFTGGASLLDPSKERGIEIELKDSNLTLAVPADKTVLQVLQAAGIDVACDCREGLCGSCEVQVLEGEIDHRDKVLTPAERAHNGKMMTCCSRALSRRLVLAL